METMAENESNKTLQGALATTAQADGLYNQLAFYFDIITEHSINIENNITDNYLENNTAIQDTIAHSPITMTLSGMVGELVYVPSTNNQRFLNQVYKTLNQNKDGDYYNNYVVTDKLSAIAQLYPPVDNVTQLAKNAIVYVEDTIDRYKKIYRNFKRNIKEKTRLEQVFKDLKDLRDLNTELIVTTPFGNFTNMYIQSINCSQGNENHVGNISVALKQLYFTDVLVTETDTNVLAKYEKAARAQVENCGKANGSYTKDSDFYKMAGEPFNLKSKTLADYKR